MKLLNTIAALALTAAPALAFDEGAFTGQQIVQTKLNALGYDVGRPDGVMGKKTLAAIKTDAEKHGYEASVSGFQNYYIRTTIEGSKPLERESLENEAKELIGTRLMDPYSAQYKDWTVLPSGNLCVKVNAKNALGAYTGYKEWHVKVSYISALLGGDPSVFSPTEDEYINFWRCMLDG